MIKFISFTLVILLLSGCGENLLLGEWVHIDKASRVCSLVKFTGDREHCDSISSEVLYQVLGDSVLVKSKQKSFLLPFDISYFFINKDLISYVSPINKKKVFLRRKGSPEVSAEAVKYSEEYSLEQLQKSCDSGPARVTHSSKYWSEVAPKKIHDDICLALKLKKNA